MATSVAIAMVLIFTAHHSLGASFREAFFSVISTMTTTGFFVSDYTAWPSFLWVVLFLLMFIGACSGSTSGGIKMFRHLIFIKNSVLELKRIIHPNAVLPVKVNGKAISTSGVYKNTTFIIIYFLVFLAGGIILLFTMLYQGGAEIGQLKCLTESKSHRIKIHIQLFQKDDTLIFFLFL